MAGLGLTAAAAAAILLAPTAIVPTATPAAAATCTWRLSSVRLYEELAGDPSPRAVQLRGLLAAAGVADPAFLPTSCRSGPSSSGPTDPAGGSTGLGAGVGVGTGNATSPATANSSAPGTGTAPGTATGTGSGSGSGNCPTTAGAALGWGQPNREDDFTDPSSTKNWGMYDGPGHAGNGRRTPTAASILGGLLTITGDAQGNSEGMAWNPGQKYGRWEGCVKSPPGADSLHSLLLLWPDAENWPVGGEVDFMEISDPARQSVDGFLHYGADNSQETANTKIDATGWHAWAVEWTQQHIAYYVDGKQWFQTTDTSHLPPGPMHLCIQLDYFGGGASAGAKEIVNWVRQYPPVTSGASSGPTSAAPPTGSSSSPSSSSGSGSSSTGSGAATPGSTSSGGSGSAGPSGSSDTSSGG
jgi:hypothetical protein